MATDTQLNMITNLIRTNMHLYNEEAVFLDYVAFMIVSREAGDHDHIKDETRNALPSQ